MIQYNQISLYHLQENIIIESMNTILEITLTKIVLNSWSY